MWYILHSTIALALVLSAFAFMFMKLFRIGAFINMGAHEEQHTDFKPARWKMVAQIVFGHRKTLEDPISGLTHIAFIYGFLVLGAGHTEIVLEGLTSFLRTWGVQPFSYAVVLPEPLLKAYHLSQDVMAAAVLLAVAVALARRLLFPPKRLQPRSLDAEIILYFILALYVTFFLLQGATLLRDNGYAFELHRSQPITSAMAMWMQHLPVTDIKVIYWSMWFAHVSVFLGFGCYIPMSKHMHLVFAGPNTWFFRTGSYGWRQHVHKDKERPLGVPPAIDFETAEKYGIDRVTELPWKTLLDSFACTECGRCNNVCPAHNTGKPLKPKKVLHDIKVNLLKKNGEQLYALRDAFGRAQMHTKEKEAELSLVALINNDEQPTAPLRAAGTSPAVDGQIHVDDAWA